MIRVRFQPKGGAAIEVEVADGKEAAVLQRAAERVFPGPFDPMEEAGSEARYQAVMRERVARKYKEGKRA